MAPAAAAAAAAFFDLSLLPPDDSSSTSTSTPKSTTSRLLAAARALELGYSAVALDHPHRGLLADSHAAAAALSSLPLPSSLSLHRRRNGSSTAEPFRQYTRITLSLDSAAAAASALAPSAARLLRTYDVVAARPLTQAAFDHLCQLHDGGGLDLISIDFSRKLPFRLRLPMLKLALLRGIHFEIAYSPLLADASTRRQVLAEAKLLAEWTKGKNLIISSAARSATEIRGPYDVINLCAYLLGISTQRAKAAMSVNCRSLISKALRKKHFYKETVRIERLLPNEQLDPANFKLGDWIGWDPMFCKEDGQSLETKFLEPSSNKHELPGSPINGLTKVSHEKSCDADECPFVEQPEQSNDDKEIPSSAETQQGTVQVTNTELSTILDKPENDGLVMDHLVQAGAVPFVDQNSIDQHVEFVQDAMDLDATESCEINLIAGACAALSYGDTAACSVLPCSMELPDSSLVNMCPHQSSGILECAEACEGYDSGSSDRVDRAPLDRGTHSVSNVSSDDKGLDLSNGISVEPEDHRDTIEPSECPPCQREDEVPLDPAVHLHSDDLWKDVMMPQQVVEERILEIMGERINHTMSMEPVDRKTTISMEHTLHDPQTSSTDYHYNEVSSDVEISPIKSGKHIQKLRSHQRHHPAYLPFLGFLKSVPFKKKACKVASKRKS